MPVGAVVHLQPDRARYGWAMSRMAGTAVAFAPLGLAATLLCRGPLRRRSPASWLLSIGAAVPRAPVGWVAVSTILWVAGPPGDPMLLGGGTGGEQVARTLLPGLALVVPALLLAAVLQSGARRQKPPPAPPAPAALSLQVWWPTPWLQQWASQGGAAPVPAPLRRPLHHRHHRPAPRGGHSQVPAVADHGIAPSGWVVAPGDGWVAPRGRTPDGRAVATPGSRLLAFLVDGVIWLVPQVLAFLALVFVLSYLSEASGSASEEEVAFYFLVPLLVFAIGMLRLAVEAEKVARRGQTWGMRALQLRAVDARNGGSLTRSRAWGRAAFATWFSTQLLGIGYWWAFFDDRNRCLHDIVCTTVVVDER